MTAPPMGRRLTAEFIGTFWLVFAGCGAALFAANPAGDSSVGVGYVGVACAFGLALLAAVYAFGDISGGHFNPAVTFGAAVAGRVAWQVVPRYWTAQVLGALGAGLSLYVIGGGRPRFSANGTMSAGGYGDDSPFHYSLTAVLIAGALLTFFFVMLVLGSTGGRTPKWYGGLSMGLGFAVVQLIAIPICITAANPAIPTGVAFFSGAGAPGQLWAFWVAPLLGAALAGWVGPGVFDRKDERAAISA